MELNKYISSGILELYALGALSERESNEVERAARQYPLVWDEISKIQLTLQVYVKVNAITPNTNLKPFLLALVSYLEKTKTLLAQPMPPLLTEQSQISDYQEWLVREDLQDPAAFEDIHAKIIGFTPEVSTAIVWLKKMAPTERHAKEYEKFLIVEGSCTITIGTEIRKMEKGNYLSIPLHIDHYVNVTSAIPCKIILQRVAA